MRLDVRQDKKLNLALVFCVLWCIAPPMLVNGTCRLIAGVCMVYCLLKRMRITPFLAVFVFWLFYTIGVGSYIRGSQYFMSQIQLLITVSFSYICVDKHWEYDSEAVRRKLERIILIVYPIFMATTLIAYIANPRISRMLVGNGTVDVVAYSYRGVGGYGMIYSLVYHNAICLYLLLNRRKKKTLIMINYVLSLLTILKAGYSIALISLLVGTIIVLSLGKLDKNGNKNLKARMFMLLFIIIVIALFIYLFNSVIISAVSDMVQGTLYQEKWEDILATLEGDSATGTFEDRQVLYNYSLENFLKHPILGTWVTGSFIFGGHSMILDMFARYGIVGGIPFLYIILYYPISQIRKRRCVGLSMALLVDIIIVGLFNNWAAAIGPILYLLYPIAVEETENDGYNNRRIEESR